MKTNPLHASARRRAFSMIELIGVMAVAAILAMALLPVLLEQLERAAAEKEQQVLQEVAQAFSEYVTTTRRIPSNATFAQDCAGVLGWLNADVSASGTRTVRQLVIDPGLRVGTNTGGPLPYTQSVLGSRYPTNARAMIVSAMGTTLPAALTNLGTNSSWFNALWNSDDGVSPTGWTNGGRFEYIKLHRMALDPLFVELTLNNNSVTMGRFAIDNTNHIALPSNPFVANYLRGTVLYLYGSDGVLQTTVIMQDPRSPVPCSFVYEKGIWRGKLFGSPNSWHRTGADLQAAYDIFMSGPPNQNAKFETTQAMVTGDMYNYMSNYIRWANSGFSSYQSDVSDSQRSMAWDSANYLFKSGTEK